ncbi:MAG TPA: choice-of-anchor Q domain-containing protein [Candidatus Angelobacter sp.]|nr:choice-of-anchor Q domain-containing protein [Candidatus Angelobacter sp.]
MVTLRALLFVLLPFTLAQTTVAVSPGNAPQLPITGKRIINVTNDSQLQSAMGNLQSGDTILLADGVYNLSHTLYVNGRNDVTIRGTAGSTNVVLVGKGMDNTNYGNVPFGIWSDSTNTTIAHLTISNTWDNEIIFNSGAQSPLVYCVRLINAGSQFIKANPTDVNAGLGVNNGVVEYCWFEYTGSPPDDHGSGIGYFNGISAHAAQNWIIRGNLFKNLHNPDSAAYLWNAAVLFWNHSVGTVTEQNTFINVDRAVAYGLRNTTPFFDHAGGVIRNNFVCLLSGLMSASRTAGSDGSLIAWNSPGTQIDHNTVLLNGNELYAIEFRFATTTNGTARNNLADAPIHLRDSATATLSSNLVTAVPGMFVNPAAADLHLLASATNAIDKGLTLSSVTNDFDGDRRPRGASSDIGADEFTTNAQPWITDVKLAGTNVVVDFSTVLGEDYDILQAASLNTNLWAILAANLPGSGGPVQFIDTNGAGLSNRFYRVRISP